MPYSCMAAWTFSSSSPRSESISVPLPLPGDAADAEEIREPAAAAAATVPAVTRRQLAPREQLRLLWTHLDYLPSFGRTPRHGGGVKRRRRSIGDDEEDQRMTGEQVLVTRTRPFAGGACWPRRSSFPL